MPSELQVIGEVGIGAAGVSTASSNLGSTGLKLFVEAMCENRVGQFRLRVPMKTGSSHELDGVASEIASVLSKVPFFEALVDRVEAGQTAVIYDTSVSSFLGLRF